MQQQEGGEETRHSVYTGIFADEAGQQLLAQSMAQIHATLGTAWRACEPKEGKLDVFGKCMDLVDTWNEKTFEQEGAVFSGQPRASDCWRASFSGFVTQVYRSSKMQVRATVPSETAYVQALLTTAAAHPEVRSGRYFTVESALERKDLAMEIIRRSVLLMCDEFVLVQEMEEAYAPGASTPAPVDEVGPDDSASQAGVAARVEKAGAGETREEEARRSSSSSSSSPAHRRPPSPSSSSRSASPRSSRSPRPAPPSLDPRNQDDASSSRSSSRSPPPSRAGHRSVTVVTQR